MRADARLIITRRSFLQGHWLAPTTWLRPLAAGFTSVADDIVWLMRWCCCGPGLRYAGAG